MQDNLFGADEKEPQKPRKRKAAKKANGATPEPESFESALEELENLVQKLESGDIPLEESVTLFERAQFLANWCQQKLDKIEGKLKLLVPGKEGEFDVEDVDDYSV